MAVSWHHVGYAVVLPASFTEMLTLQLLAAKREKEKQPLR